MINTEIYFEDIDKLARSVTCKINGIAWTMNNYINEHYNLTNQFNLEPKDWKYYKNLSGEYHVVDLLNYPNGLEIELLESGNKVSLTKEILANNFYTRQDLISHGPLYEKLITMYPKAHLLIRGLCHPTEIEYLLDSPDGTILGYNGYLVEKYEVTLINDIQKALILFLGRWNLENYALLDELYIAILVRDTVNFIKLKIHSLRLANIHTYAAHEYHVTEFFKSHMSLDNASEVLAHKEKMWLYKHLKYLIHNLGQDKTLTELLNNVIIPSNIEVKEYITSVNLPMLHSEPVLTDPTVASWYIPDGNLYIDTESGISEKKDLREVSIDIFKASNIFDDFYFDNENTLITNTETELKGTKFSEPTKVLTLENTGSHMLYPLNKTEIILEHWFYLVMKKGYGNNVSYRDEQTEKEHSLTHKQAVLLVIKFLLLITGRVNYGIDKMRINSVVSEDDLSTIGEDVILSSLYDDLNVSFTSFISNIPNNNITILNPIDVYINRMIDWYVRIWGESVYEVNPVKTSLKGLLLDRARVPIDIVLSTDIETIDDILTENNVIFYIPDGYDYFIAIRDLTLSFTGINIDEVGNRESILDNFVEIIDKLTSYSVIVTKSDTIVPYNLNVTKPGILRGLDASKIYDGRSYCLELPYHTISGQIDNNGDRVLIENLGMYVELDDIRPNPTLYVSDDTDQPQFDRVHISPLSYGHDTSGNVINESVRKAGVLVPIGSLYSPTVNIHETIKLNYIGMLFKPYL